MRTIDRGRCVAAGTPGELTQPATTGQLRLRARPGLDITELGAITGTRVSESAGAYLIEGDIDPQLLATVTAWCAARGVLAEELRVRTRTLEDTFLELTGRELRA